MLSCGGTLPLGRAPGARLVPVQALHIHQDPHQFWDGQSRVGVVQLDRHLLSMRQRGRKRLSRDVKSRESMQDAHFVRKRFKSGSDGTSAAKLRGLEPANDVLQRRGHHKVFLLQAQFLPFKELQIKNDHGRV